MATTTPSDGAAPPRGPVRVVIIYAPADEKLLHELEDHLAPLRWEEMIEIWHRGMIGAGEAQEATLIRRLEAAQVVVPMLSASFLAGNDRASLLVRAMERQRVGEVMLVPVIARPLDLRGAPLVGLQTLPRDGRAVTAWCDRHAAWMEVAGAIRDTASTLRGRPANTTLPDDSPRVALPVEPLQDVPPAAGGPKVRFEFRRRTLAFALSLGGIAVVLTWRLIGHREGWRWVPPQPVLGIPDLSMSPQDLGSLERPRDMTEAPPNREKNRPIPIFRGTVIDKRTEAPLKGAIVWLLGTRCKVRTDEFGAFTFSGCDDERVPLLKKPRVYMNHGWSFGQ